MTPPSSPAPRAPSRELDALIAEKVMGWTADQFRYHAVEREGNSPYYASFGMGDATLAEITAACAHYASRRFRPEVANVPEYSTDIAAAWHVVERMHATGWAVTLDYSGVTAADAHWLATFANVDGEKDTVEELASTAPLAICRAALAAVAPPRAPLEGE